VGAVLLLASALAVAATKGASAGDGLAFPAPTGTVWSVVSGYNTPTHTGSDPYAIDVVRDDAPTAGTAVLSPVAGEIGYTSSDCLTVRDAADVRILLCHVFPDANLERGVRVVRGQRIATVAPAGHANNNGLAHIHIAAHYGSTRNFGSTLPLAGAYAIEGVQLAPTNTWSAYAGRTFRSTNGLAGPPTVAAPPTQPPAEALAGFEVRGTSLAVVVSPLATPELVATIAARGARSCTLASVQAGVWVTYIVGAPAQANARWSTAFAGRLPAYTPVFTRCG
jgi:hypothetical protein